MKAPQAEIVTQTQLHFYNAVITRKLKFRQAYVHLERKKSTS